MVGNRWLKVFQGVRGLWAVVAFANLFIFAMVALDLQGDRAERRNLTEKNLLEMSRGLENHIAAVLDKVDLCLLTAGDEIQRQQLVGREDGAALDALLERLVARSPEILGLRITDGQGGIRHASGGMASREGNVSDRERFARLRRDAGAGLVLEGPLMSPASGKMVIVLARRLSRVDGSFGGEVHAFLEVSRLTSLAAALNLGAGGRVSLWNENKRILMSQSGKGGQADATPSRELSVLMDSGRTFATFDAARSEGGQLPFQFRRIAGRPLYLTVGLADQTWLLPWYQGLWRLGGMMGAFLLLSLVSARLIHKGVVAQDKAAADLVRTSADLQAVLDHVPALIGYWDRELRNRFGNHAYLPWFGMAPESLRGKSMAEVLGEDRFQRNLPYIEGALRGEAQRFEQSIALADGRQLATLVHYVPDVRNGAVQGFYALSMDVTPEKQAEKESARVALRNQSLLHAASDGIHVLTEDGRLREASDTFCAMLGYERQEMLGMPMSQWDARGSAEELEEVVRGLLAGKTVFETRYRCRGGERLEVEISSVGLDLDGEKLLYCSARDITERKEAQRALASHQIQLEEKLLQGAAELQLARQEAERLARVKGDFLANLSHEIRTPLNAIMGLSRKGAKDSAGREIGEVFTRIQDAGALLLGVVNDIRDFSRIEAGKLVLEEQDVDLPEILDRAVNMVAPRAFGKKLEFSLEEAPGLPRRMWGDGLRLTQVLVNLLGNAISFTDPGGRVSLLVAREGGQLVFAVTDTGVGMAPGQVERLFAPFEQADGSTRGRYGRTGLGLAICKRLVDLMQGEIRVDSVQGSGSTFRVSLPYRERPGSDSASFTSSLAGEGLGAGENGQADARFCAPLSGQRVAPGAAKGEVALCGMNDREAARLHGELSLAGVAVRILGPGLALPETTTLVVTDGASCQGRCGALNEAVARGIKVLLVVTPEAEAGECLRVERARQILRPLRSRQVLRAMEEAAVVCPPALPRPRLSGVRILAAEDNEMNRLVLEDMLLGEGAVYDCVENGRELVDRLRRDGPDTFDIIVTDIQMPEMDGLEAAGLVLAMAPDLPIICLTAHAMPEERQRSLAAGLVEHVAKPVDVDTLVAAILRHAKSPAPPDAARLGAEAAAGPPCEAGVYTAEEAKPGGPGRGATDMGVDWPAMEERYRGKATFIAKVLRMAIAGNRDLAEKLHQAADRGDLPAVAKIAHNLKSLGGNLAAPTFVLLATRVDTAAKAGVPEVFDLGRDLAVALAALLKNAGSRLDAEGNYLGM